MTKIKRNGVFISYSHRDIDYLNMMKRHFTIFNDKVVIWDDSRILPGDLWKNKILEALGNAKIVLLLISADFFSSTFITNVELPLLLKAAEEDGAVILSLIVKPCLFSEYHELNRFQTINPPDKPLSKMDVSQLEETFVETALALKKTLKV